MKMKPPRIRGGFLYNSIALGPALTRIKHKIRKEIRKESAPYTLLTIVQMYCDRHESFPEVVKKPINTHLKSDNISIIAVY